MKRTRFPMPPEMKAQLEIRRAAEEAAQRDAASPRVGPKPPKILPEEPNKKGY